MNSPSLEKIDSPAALRIQDLSYTYTGDWTRKKTPALKNISLAVEPGESFGFLGHNGAGKTTAIKCILNLIKPQSGAVTIFGKTSRGCESRRDVGYVAEQPYFYDNLTVAELLTMYSTLAGIPHAQQKEAIARTLTSVGLTERQNTPMRSLSKGLLQRAAMAQAIVSQPRLLILDEPFSGLDPIGRKEFRELLCALKQSGATIFMSSHILSDVEFLCDRVSIMVRGEIKGVFPLRNLPEGHLPEGNPPSGAFELVLRYDPRINSLFAGLYEKLNSENKFVRLTFNGRDKAEKALALALQQGISIESFEFVHGGLEELFVRLVGYESNREVIKP